MCRLQTPDAAAADRVNAAGCWCSYALGGGSAVRQSEHGRWRSEVEPKLPDVLPNCTLGNHTLGNRTQVLSALLHFLQGLTISQVVDTFNLHLRMKVTPGGLVQRWHRLADRLFAWYEQRLQPQRAWCLDPLGADVRLSHLETPQPP